MFSRNHEEYTPVASNAPETEETTDTETSEEVVEDEEEPTEEANSSDVDTTALVNNGCIACHSANSVGMEGGNAGPDLSLAYSQTEDKHGKPLDEFLQEPTSAVMSTVIEDNPLTEEQIQAIVDTLEEADDQ